MRVRAREKILRYVAGHPASDAAQIAGALGMQVPAVRHHLSILRSDGRVETASPKRGAEAGRPRLSYRVSEVLAGNNLAMLAEHLLTAWNAEASPGSKDAGGAPTLGRMLSEKLKASQPEARPAKRLETLVGHLNELHYESRWEAGEHGPRLIFGRCPYAAVIVNHPELCAMDREAISLVMAADVEQRAKTGPGGQDPACVFALKYA